MLRKKRYRCLWSNGGKVIGRGKVKRSLEGEMWNGNWEGKCGMVIGRENVEWSLEGEMWNGHWRGNVE